MVIEYGQVSACRRGFEEDFDLQEVQGPQQEGRGEVQEVRLQAPEAEENRDKGEKVGSWLA